ncbi:ATP-grasp domain-containing protein [Luteimonas sp. MC1782]|uniref:carboxylate--amine ligase n=1 Tax=Luteimonas sp. MC1782 TaxID=2760305 RepID=UPI001601324B|nr:ATP-grasp domain-containing protein [Luteimonas sp. MC1782]MBB1472224.1 ATP-grasp domain-containing protein [Luteimonas sp. MC1782]
MTGIESLGGPLPAAFATYGWCRSTYTVVKSLALRGVAVHVGDSSPMAMSRYSRYCKSFTRLPDFYEKPEQYVDALALAMEKTGAKVLLPCFEDIEVVIRHRSRLPDHVLMALPGLADWERAEDKYDYVQALESTSCPTPRTRKIGSADELADIRKDFTFPVVVKIRTGNGSRGVEIVDRPDDLESTFFRIVDTFGLPPHRWPVIQERLTGRKFKQEGIFVGGHSVANVVYQILRCKEPDLFGTSTLRETLDHPELAGYAVDALSALNWNGVYNTDWICDEEGTPHLIDINGRLSGALAICYAAGVDIPWMWYQMAIGRVPDPQLAEPGVRARWLLGDMIGVVQHLRAGAFRQMLQIFRPQRGYIDDFSLADPVPLGAEAADYLYKFVSSGGSFTPTTKGMVR